MIRKPQTQTEPEAEALVGFAATQDNTAVGPPLCDAHEEVGVLSSQLGEDTSYHIVLYYIILYTIY